jgi:hypothetical protein
MFRGLLANLQVALHVQHLFHCVRVILMQYTKCAALLEDEQVVLKTCKGR